MVDPTLSIVVVAFNSAKALGGTLPALVEQLSQGDELIVVDNGSTDASPEVVAALAPGARLVQMGSNTGFAAAANAGADAANGDLLLLLNPDARPQPGFRAAIAKPWIEQRGWAAWMGLVTFDGASKVNTSGNPVHFAGFAWAGGHGLPLEAFAPHEVTALSGACLALPLATFRRIRGFPEQYFLYHEDIDLSMRLRLEGGRLGLEPTAVVDHDYDFGGGPKMRLLERNRWAFLLRVYPAPLLALLMPALLLTELALIAVSIGGRWGRQKLLADVDLIRSLPWVLRSRRTIQQRRTITTAEFAALLTAELDSPFFGAVGRSRVVRLALKAYWAAVLALLGRSARQL